MSVVAGGGRDSGGPRERHLSRHAEALAAAGENAHARASRQHGVDELGNGTEEVLAIVEDQQQPAARQVGEDGVLDGIGPLVSLRADAQRLGHCGGDGRAVLKPTQLDEPDPVRISLERRRGGMEREARLACASHARKRHQSRRRHQCLDLLELTGSSDELRQAGGQVVARVDDPARGQRRELLGQPHNDGLIDPFRTSHILQSNESDITHERPITHEARRHLRAQDLTAVRDAHQPSGHVHRWTEVVALAFDGFSSVQPHPHLQPDGIRPRLSRQCSLGVDRRVERLLRSGERDRERIAGGRKDVATVCCRAPAHDFVVDP